MLLLADESPHGPSKKDKEIMEVLGVCAQTVALTRQHFTEGDIEGVLNEKARSSRPREFTGREEAKLTLIACSEPPEGRNRWSVRLLSDKLVELDVVDSISRESVRKYLKKGMSSRVPGLTGGMVHRQDNRRVSGSHGEYIGSV
ncbi:helix-turn-helix domain-containing protein [Candidatus Poribacteria bacterium]